MFMHGCMCTYVHVEATGQSQVPYPQSHPPYFITKTSSLTSLEFANGQADCPARLRDLSPSPSAGSTSMCPCTQLFYMGTGGQLKPWHFCRKCFTIRLPSFQPQALERAAKGPSDGDRNWKLSSRLAIQFSLVYGFSWGKISTVNPASSNDVRHFTGAQRPVLRAGWVF